MNSALSNARHQGETFKNYRVRIKVVALQLKGYLRGQLLHTSSYVVSLPLKADSTEQEKFDRHIGLGHILDVQEAVLKSGDKARIGRSKGVTYHRNHWRRHEERAIVKAFPRVAA